MADDAQVEDLLNQKNWQDERRKLRDILLDEGYRDDLIAERGRATVPVLRITSPDGSERWMPESADIIAYLEELYGKPE